MDSVIQAINEHKIWYFINKPWNTLELQQIVKNGVELYESRFHERELNKQLAEKNALLNVSQKALVRANNDLENVVEQRTIELSKALERLEIIDKTKNDFFSLLSHELRTPLNGIIGIGLLAFDERPNSPQNEKLHGLFDKASERILTLIDDALFFGQLQENVNTPAVSSVPLKNIIGQAYEQVTEYAVQRGVEIIHDDVVEKNIRGDRDLLKKAFRSLMRIAINLCPKNKAVRINTQATVTGVDVHFVTDELSLKPDSIKSFFEVLGVNDIVTPDCNLGLDPVIAKRIVNMFGGTVHIENLSPAGICLKVMLAG
jgi:signal transduction histidine kinase